VLDLGKPSILDKFVRFMLLSLSNCRIKSLFGDDKALKVFASRSTLLAFMVGVLVFAF